MGAPFIHSMGWLVTLHSLDYPLYKLLGYPVPVLRDGKQAIPIAVTTVKDGGSVEGVCFCLRGNWYVPTVHKGNTSDRGGFPVGGWVSLGWLAPYILKASDVAEMVF